MKITCEKKYSSAQNDLYFRSFNTKEIVLQIIKTVLDIIEKKEKYLTGIELTCRWVSWIRPAYTISCLFAQKQLKHFRSFIFSPCFFLSVQKTICYAREFMQYRSSPQGFLVGQEKTANHHHEVRKSFSKLSLHATNALSRGGQNLVWLQKIGLISLAARGCDYAIPITRGLVGLRLVRASMSYTKSLSQFWEGVGRNTSTCENSVDWRLFANLAFNTYWLAQMLFLSWYSCNPLIVLSIETAAFAYSFFSASIKGQEDPPKPVKVAS